MDECSVLIERGPDRAMILPDGIVYTRWDSAQGAWRPDPSPGVKFRLMAEMVRCLAFEPETDDLCDLAALDEA